LTESQRLSAREAAKPHKQKSDHPHLKTICPNFAAYDRLSAQ